MNAAAANISSEDFNQLCLDYMNFLYTGISGFISYQPGEKEEGEKKKVYMTYGEILYPGINRIMDYIGDIREDDVFYDLGSGVGKIALQFFLKTPVKKSRGIEYSETRNNSAIGVYKQVHQEFPELFQGGKRTLDCINGNFLEADIADATIIYAASTCYSEELLADIGKMITERCPKVRYVVTLKPIPSKVPLDKVFEVECSWDKLTKCHGYTWPKEGSTAASE